MSTLTTATATTLTEIERVAIMPVVTIDHVDTALDVAASLRSGGIRCAEVTLRTPAGLAAIAAMAALPDFLVGAGTVITADDVDRCVDAGARFIVSPGFDEVVVERALARGVAVLPGVATASELQRAVRSGLSEVKFFPADRLGGLGTIAALAAPFPGVRFLPSGGVTVSNAAEYLAHAAVFAVAGSWMVPRASIANRDFRAIERLSAEAVAAIELSRARA